MTHALQPVASREGYELGWHQAQAEQTRSQEKQKHELPSRDHDAQHVICYLR